MKLVGTIQPFIGMQSIHLYSDDNKEQEYRLAYISNYAAAVMKFLDDFPEITELNLHGAEKFCTKLKNEIEANLLSKYENNKRIEVKIL